MFFTLFQIRVTGLHMEEDFHVCYSTLQKQGKSIKFLFSLTAVMWCYAIFHVCYAEMENSILRKINCCSLALLCVDFCSKTFKMYVCFQMFCFSWCPDGKQYRRVSWSCQTVSTNVLYFSVVYSVKDDNKGWIYQHLCLKMLMCDGLLKRVNASQYLHLSNRGMSN